MQRWQTYGKDLRELAGLRWHPVGVAFFHTEEAAGLVASLHEAKAERYCQALMWARRGENLLVTGESLSCPAGAAAFGFRPLPEGLARGTGLVEHGLAPSADVGERLLERNPRLQLGAVWGLALGPLESLVAVPDVIIIQDEAEKEMWGWWSA